MKKHAIYIILVFSSLFSNGQNEQLKALFSKANKYRALKDSGLYYAGEAHLLSRELRFRQGEQISKMYAGIVYYNAGEIDTATSLLYDALPYLADLDFEKGMAHWYIGKIHVRSRDFENGENHYLSASEAFSAIDSITLLGDVYNSLGIIHGMQTNYTDALEWFTKSYQMKVENGLGKTTSSELNNIGLVYMRMASFEKAIEYIWKSINIDPEAVNQAGYSTLGGIYNYMGKQDSALIFYEISLQKAIKSGNKYSQSIATSNLSNIYFQRGEFQKAINQLKEALVLSEDNVKAQFSIFTELGKSYRGLKMADSASYFLRKGYKLAREQKDKNWAIESSTFLGFFYSDYQKFDSAFHYLTLALEYKDSLNNDQVQEIFADQRVKLETSKKQHEIEELEREREISQYKEKTLITGGGFLIIIGILGFLNYRSRLLLKQKTLNEKNLLLEKALEKSRAELSAHTLNMIHRKNSMNEIEVHINKLEGKEKQKIKSIINVNKALEKDWENFKNYFGQVHANFFDILREQFPSLSQSEIRLSALIKMNLANNEIATLLNIESKSVRMARYRLRKKFDLPEEIDLNQFIHKLA
jgi:tetratricopeptide (TPR) repeat protein